MNTASLGALLSGASSGDDEPLVQRVLALARTHLDLDVAWLARIDGDEHRLEHIHGDAAAFGVSPGVSTSHADTYCSRVIAGDLPNIVHDARQDARTRDLAVTHEVGIGAYVGVPVLLPDGEIYGMMCCLGQDAHPELDARDLKFLNVLAAVMSEDVQRRRPLEEQREATLARVDAAIAGDGMRMVFQPIVQISSGAVVGAEALSRFVGGPPTPDGWFRDAAGVGKGVELELASLRMAVASLADLPLETYLSVNASPELISLWADRPMPDGVRYDRLVLEITEHAPILDYGPLKAALNRLRERGGRIAIDDAGAGYSSFRHILQVKPDLIKLDISITRDVDRDSSRRALASALSTFAGEVGATLVAEGVETVAELETLQRLGVTTAQGYLFARPGPLPMPARLSAGGRQVPTIAARGAPPRDRRRRPRGVPGANAA